MPLEHGAPAFERVAPYKSKVLLDFSILHPERTDVPGISSLSFSKGVDYLTHQLHLTL
jgi:hypothetical protein